MSYDKKLLALLVRLSHIHGELEGRWFIEWACRDELTSREIFADLETVSNWISKQLHQISS